MSDCPFCQIIDTQSDRIVAQNEHAIAIRDGFPVTEGHTLIIPKTHEGSFFHLSDTVQTALLELLSQQRELLSEQLGVKDCNVGINDGPDAGQTVPHCHIHLIPRKSGDVTDPRGGVRWVVPDKADYWSKR
jgi:diadenosine tetraphosphate (Ap4A) HIT family hydrolase